MSWFYLFLAIILEVSGTISMKLSQGFTKVIPSILMFVLYILSITALALALKKIDMSVAYAVWSGLGTAIIATVGFLWFKEPVSALKLSAIGLIITGVIILNICGEAPVELVKSHHN
jgi:small multidrug resistance pump